MRQMPTEAKNFRRMDKIWRTIMTYVANNRRVVDATDMPNMLQEFQLCNTLLDEIQKGLNDYLEKKRLFLPRGSSSCRTTSCWRSFPRRRDHPESAASLEEMPSKVSSRLRFTNEEEIIGMLSDQEEYVPLSGKITQPTLKGWWRGG